MMVNCPPKSLFSVLPGKQQTYTSQCSFKVRCGQIIKFTSMNMAGCDMNHFQDWPIKPSSVGSSILSASAWMKGQHSHILHNGLKMKEPSSAWIPAYLYGRELPSSPRMPTLVYTRENYTSTFAPLYVDWVYYLQQLASSNNTKSLYVKRSNSLKTRYSRLMWFLFLVPTGSLKSS